VLLLSDWFQASIEGHQLAAPGRKAALAMLRIPPPPSSDSSQRRGRTSSSNNVILPQDAGFTVVPSGPSGSASDIFFKAARRPSSDSFDHDDMNWAAEILSESESEGPSRRTRAGSVQPRMRALKASESDWFSEVSESEAVHAQRRNRAGEKKVKRKVKLKRRNSESSSENPHDNGKHQPVVETPRRTRKTTEEGRVKAIKTPLDDDNHPHQRSTSSLKEKSSRPTRTVEKSRRSTRTLEASKGGEAAKEAEVQKEGEADATATTETKERPKLRKNGESSTRKTVVHRERITKLREMFDGPNNSSVSNLRSSTGDLPVEPKTVRVKRRTVDPETAASMESSCLTDSEAKPRTSSKLKSTKKVVEGEPDRSKRAVRTTALRASIEGRPPDGTRSSSRVRAVSPESSSTDKSDSLRRSSMGPRLTPSLNTSSSSDISASNNGSFSEAPRSLLDDIAAPVPLRRKKSLDDFVEEHSGHRRPDKASSRSVQEKTKRIVKIKVSSTASLPDQAMTPDQEAWKTVMDLINKRKVRGDSSKSLSISQSSHSSGKGRREDI
jgi:hypothetical protein